MVYKMLVDSDEDFLLQFLYGRCMQGVRFFVVFLRYKRTEYFS